MWRRAEHQLDRLGRALMEDRVWSAALVVLALLVLGSGWLFVPGPDEAVTLFGTTPFPPCPVLEATGAPCSQCGMTRSWVWAARGDLGRAWEYNPSALVAWVWVMAGGLVGGVRLVRRDGSFLRMRWLVLAAAAAAWLGLHLGTFALRQGGWNPLPGSVDPQCADTVIDLRFSSVNPYIRVDVG